MLWFLILVVMRGRVYLWGRRFGGGGIGLPGIRLGRCYLWLSELGIFRGD